MSGEKILIIGNLAGWMGWHLELSRRGFEDAGCRVMLADYHRMSRPLGLPVLSGKYEAKWREYQLERLLRRFQPDAILFVASLKFDLRWLRTIFAKPIVYFEYDGWKVLEPFLDQLRETDYVASSSHAVVRRLAGNGIRGRYIPGAVDTDWYSPGEVGADQRQAYGSPVSFVGRATPRRIEYCSAIADCGLTVYGRRWCREPACAPGGILAGAVRYRRDMDHDEVRTIYRASGVVINILREGMDLLSLQGFDVPSCGACLCTEKVPELEELFEPGRELLSFSSPEELHDQVARMLREPETARRIGAAGRKRCLADYTFRHRAERLLHELR